MKEKVTIEVEDIHQARELISILSDSEVEVRENKIYQSIHSGKSYRGFNVSYSIPEDSTVLLTFKRLN